MTSYQYISGIVPSSQVGQRLDKAVVKLFPLYSRSRIKTWIVNGQVRINGLVTTIPKKNMCGGEFIEIDVVNKEQTFCKAQNITLNIVYEDADLIVINKPCNFVVHPGAGNAEGTVLNALLYYYPPIVTVPRAGIIHRLDKDTTGLMVVAKNIQTQLRLVKLLQAREIIREYEAIVLGIITNDGRVEQPIARHPVKRTHMAVNMMGKPAITHYRIIEHFRNFTRIRLWLETGRTHQIRVHMAYINHPIIGDQLYNNHKMIIKSQADKNVLCNFNRQALHASRLQFIHPITSIKMELHAPLPHDIVALINILRGRM